MKLIKVLEIMEMLIKDDFKIPDTLIPSLVQVIQLISHLQGMGISSCKISVEEELEIISSKGCFINSFDILLPTLLCHSVGVVHFKTNPEPLYWIGFISGHKIFFHQLNSLIIL